MVASAKPDRLMQSPRNPSRNLMLLKTLTHQVMMKRLSGKSTNCCTVTRPLMTPPTSLVWPSRHPVPLDTALFMSMWIPAVSIPLQPTLHPTNPLLWQMVGVIPASLAPTGMFSNILIDMPTWLVLMNSLPANPDFPLSLP